MTKNSGEIQSQKVTEDNCNHPANRMMPTSVGIRCGKCTKLMGKHEDSDLTKVEGEVK
jgi:hypothetical protein